MEPASGLAISILVAFGIIIGVAVFGFIFFRTGRKKPDYRRMIEDAIDIPFSSIDLVKFEAQLQRSSHEIFRPDSIPKRYCVTLRRLERHPKSIQFAKAGSIPIQVYYEVAVMKERRADYGTNLDSVWTEEYDSLYGAVSNMSRWAKPIQQGPITPQVPAPVEIAANAMQDLQKRIDTWEEMLEKVKLDKYINQGVTLADVAMLEGCQDYFDLLKQRDELMWAEDASQKKEDVAS